MRQDVLRVGLIGYGAIGQEVNRLLTQRDEDNIKIVGALVHSVNRPRPHLYANLAESLYLRLLSIWLYSSERTDDPGSSTLRLKR